MGELYLAVTITDRNMASKFLHLYKEHHVELSLITLGKGTANSDVLDYLGLYASEKAVILGFVTDIIWKTVKKELERKLQIDVPGTGIAFTIPLSSIGGKRELLFLTQNQNFVKGVESTLKDTKHDLLLVIANQGYSNLIMDTARSAGAAGGTIIHAKGMGMEQAEKFLGVSLASEKEITFIITKSDQKNSIMQAIMTHAGLESKAKAIVISLPVTSTAGLRLIEDEDSSQL